MIFGKHINKYYLKYGYLLIGGVLALLLVDFMQLKIPELYRMVLEGIQFGEVEVSVGVYTAFDMEFLLDYICRPLLWIILALVFGRFLWRVCLFGAGIQLSTDLRSEMFNHAKHLSQEYYQKNKVGNMMSLFTNDLETVQECFGDGVLMFADALLLGVLAIAKMAKMNLLLTFLSLIPMAMLLAVSTVVGKNMMRKWEARQEAFSALSDFIIAFVGVL